jgi:hypothetical protein
MDLFNPINIDILIVKVSANHKLLSALLIGNDIDAMIGKILMESIQENKKYLLILFIEKVLLKLLVVVCILLP